MPKSDVSKVAEMIEKWLLDWEILDEPLEPVGKWRLQRGLSTRIVKALEKGRKK